MTRLNFPLVMLMNFQVKLTNISRLPMPLSTNPIRTSKSKLPLLNPSLHISAPFLLLSLSDSTSTQVQDSPALFSHAVYKKSGIFLLIEVLTTLILMREKAKQMKMTLKRKLTRKRSKIKKKSIHKSINKRKKNGRNQKDSQVTFHESATQIYKTRQLTVLSKKRINKKTAIKLRRTVQKRLKNPKSHRVRLHLQMKKASLLLPNRFNSQSKYSKQLLQ